MPRSWPPSSCRSSLGAVLARAFFVACMGLSGWLTISVPYWNWYGFPAAFTVAEGIDQVAGRLLAGLVLAAIVRPARR